MIPIPPKRIFYNEVLGLVYNNPSTYFANMWKSVEIDDSDVSKLLDETLGVIRRTVGIRVYSSTKKILNDPIRNIKS